MFWDNPLCSYNKHWKGFFKTMGQEASSDGHPLGIIKQETNTQYKYCLLFLDCSYIQLDLEGYGLVEGVAASEWPLDSKQQNETRFVYKQSF